MDTKWKKFKAFFGWTTRLIVCFWVFIALHAAMYGQYSDTWKDLRDLAFNEPEYNTQWLRNQAVNLMSNMLFEFIEVDDDNYGTRGRNPSAEWLADHGANVAYYAKDIVSGRSVGDPERIINEDLYGLKIVVENGTATAYAKNGTSRNVNIYNFPYTVNWQNEDGSWNEGRTYELKDFYAVLWVRTPLDPSIGRSYLSNMARNREIERIVLYVFLGLNALCLLFALIFFRHKKNTDRAIAKVTRHIWFEFKLVAFIFGVAIGVTLLNGSWLPDFILWGLCTWLGLYILWSDLLVNKGHVFTHNSISTVRRAWHSFLSKKPFQKRMLIEFVALVIVELILLSFAALFFAAAINGDGEWLILTLILAATGLFILWRYVKRYKRMIGDLGRLIDHVAYMDSGNFANTLDIPENAVLYPVAQSVNGIQNAFSNALQKATKSERMKVDLITNVSHDLKTPLTSIISYVELLSQMELPDEAAEHVSVIANKSERLKLLIQDLFDLSKSTSGSIEMSYETIDLARLAEQTLSDGGTSDAFKVLLSDRPLWIRADGGKLSRALHNLIDNAKKYSLASTRVYVDTFREGERAVLEIKNIANYEMDFRPDEIAERFVRGDASRSTEGSGLGLSIAQSFTEACGGSFRICVDGDMFKVRMTFALVSPPEPRG